MLARLYFLLSLLPICTLSRVNCRPGYYDITAGSSNYWACGEGCEGGFFTDGGCQCACQVCPKNTYAQGWGTHVCTDCPEGKAIAHERISFLREASDPEAAELHDNREDCVPSLVAAGCPPGEAWDAAATACTTCPAGRWSSGSTTGEECVLCGQGKYSDIPGGTDEGSCKICTGGSSSAEEGRTSCDVEECYDLHMLDTYGDGWNGAVLAFSKTTEISGADEPLLQDFTFHYDDSTSSRTGYSKKYTPVCFPMGSCYRGKATKGLYPNEISWKLTRIDGDGTVASASQDNQSEEFCVKSVTDCRDACPGGSELDMTFSESGWDGEDCTDPNLPCTKCSPGKFRHLHGDAYCSYCSAFDPNSKPNLNQDACVCAPDGYGMIPPYSYRPESLARIVDPSTGHLAIINEELKLRGRLEVRNEVGMSWGTVCDDNFKLKEATVACREVGAAYGLKGGDVVIWNDFDGESNGNAGGAIWLDELECQGNEMKLSNCTYSGWGVHDCTHFEDQFIECTFEHDNTVAISECFDCEAIGMAYVKEGEWSYCVDNPPPEIPSEIWLSTSFTWLPIIIVFIVFIACMLGCRMHKKRGGRGDSIFGRNSVGVANHEAGTEGGVFGWSMRGGLTATVRELSWRARGSTFWNMRESQGESAPPIVIATPMHGNERIVAISAIGAQQRL
mmetsp:Transcript_20721/g.43358  ORF Transcript_20721/g.43358 Transcript_20721/m.43358 type:complete len:675 (+) Transcript_20721:30-2054(+)